MRATLAALCASFLIAGEALSQASPPVPTATPTPATPQVSPLATETPSVTPTSSSGPLTTPSPVGSATATPASTPLVDPTETPPLIVGPPILGGRVEVLSVEDARGSEGDTVVSGRFAIENTTGADESITEVEIEATDPSLVSAFTLEATLPNGSFQTSTQDDPDSTNLFRFDPALVIPAGGAAILELIAKIGDGGSASSTATPEATTTATVSATVTPEATTTATVSGTVTPEATTTATASATATPETTTTATPITSPTATTSQPATTHRGRGGTPPLMLTTLFLAIASPAFGYGRRLKAARVLAGSMAIAFVATRALTGCGWEDTTTQTLTAVRGSSAGAPLIFSGVPASIGSVSRPTLLVFPGSSSDEAATPTP